METVGGNCIQLHNKKMDQSITFYNTIELFHDIQNGVTEETVNKLHSFAYVIDVNQTVEHLPWTFPMTGLGYLVTVRHVKSSFVVNAAKALLRRGSSPNALTGSGYPIIFWCIHQGGFDMINILLQWNVNLNIPQQLTKDQFYDADKLRHPVTPLQFAFHYRRADMLNILLREVEYGLNPTIGFDPTTSPDNGLFKPMEDLNGVTSKALYLHAITIQWPAYVADWNRILLHEFEVYNLPFDLLSLIARFLSIYNNNHKLSKEQLLLLQLGK